GSALALPLAALMTVFQWIGCAGRKRSSRPNSATRGARTRRAPGRCSRDRGGAEAPDPAFEGGDRAREPLTRSPRIAETPRHAHLLPRDGRAAAARAAAPRRRRAGPAPRGLHGPEEPQARDRRARGPGAGRRVGAIPSRAASARGPDRG